MAVIDRLNSLRDWFLAPLIGMMDNAQNARLSEMATYRSYSAGAQKPQLAVKVGKADDNIIINLCGPIISKSVAMLMGGEVKFDLGEKAPDDAVQFLDAIWEKNRKPILLHNLADIGGQAGTFYIKIMVDYYGEKLHRLVSLDPAQMEIYTDPGDVERVEKYVQEWGEVREIDGKRRKFLVRETTYRAEGGVDENGNEIEAGAWRVRVEERERAKWEQVSDEAWPYDFPPILHGQNLPNDFSPYGVSDLVDAIPLQDKINYVASNIAKIIRYHAHPRTVGIGFTAKEVEMRADQMFTISNPQGQLFNLEMQSDLVSSFSFLKSLEETLYAITGTVEPASVKDKLGQLTNFGLRVVYQTALEKLHIKRNTYGEFLTELNKRLLALSGFEDMTLEVVWPVNVLPENQNEEADTLTKDLSNKLVSRETAMQLRGYDAETELSRIQQERAEDPLGETILNALNAGRG